MHQTTFVRATFMATMLLSTATAVHAQQPRFHGQIRPRFESRDPSGGPGDSFTSMRVRFGFDVLLEQDLSIFIQAQDVRLWGEELSTKSDFQADHLDVHQAYLTYNPDRFEWLTAKVGRQESPFGGQRLVGQVNFSQQGQSFDGARLDLRGDRGTAAVVGYVISDQTAGNAAQDRQLFGVYGTREEVGPGALDVYWLFQRTRAGVDTNEHSFGGRYVFDGEVDGRVEATIQSGSRAGVDVASFMVGARIGTALADGQVHATLWYDYVSGDDPSTPEVEVFDVPFATGHKFYGFADIFTNIPVHTGGAGLQDLAAKLAFMPTEDLSAGVDLHRFLAAERGGLSGSHLADEIDVTVNRRITTSFDMTAGLSYVFQDDPLGEIGRLSGDQRWFYLMLDAAF